MLNEGLEQARTSELTLKELMALDGMDHRRYNLCKTHGIYTLAQLIDHYLEFGSFLGWRNCGQLSNLMLISTCKKYSRVDTNVLRLERKPMEFSDRDVAFSALESGFVDAVIFIKPSDSSTSEGKVLIEGRVAVCKSYEV